ncbi:helix-turn-helix transcriptional regulator [Streptomyces sp. NPDC001508]|uniref:helix-turn-helix transcriptional regulator n=1 Tax=Streptomyces sp. NPDC001508 TaxID=3154656 RepID=UPI00332D0335
MPITPPDGWTLQRRREIGTRIREARLWANLTQEGLRDASGVDRATIQRIEAGTTDPRLSWLLRIADALDVPLADLVR